VLGSRRASAIVGTKTTPKQVGNGELGNWVDTNIRDNSRVYSDHDLVPYTPTTHPGGYTHLGKFIHVKAHYVGEKLEEGIEVEWHHCHGMFVYHLRSLRVVVGVTLRTSHRRRLQE
jgi:hypothetical protein